MTRLVLLGLAACGRLGFGDGSQQVDGDTIPDAEVPGVCGHVQTAPDPVHVAGTVFRYTSFDNERTPLAGATVTAIVPGTTEMTTSAADGTYDAAVPTGGVARPLRMRYTLGSDFTTDVVFDHAIDRDVTGPNMPVLQLGDAPIWESMGMDAIYNAIGLTRDPTGGFINISVRDCLGNPIAGALLDLQPAPEALLYQADDGRLMAAGPTDARFGQVFAANAVAGTTTITVTHATKTFEPFTFDVNGGTFNTLVVARATN